MLDIVQLDRSFQAMRMWNPGAGRREWSAAAEAFVRGSPIRQADEKAARACRTRFPGIRTILACIKRYNVGRNRGWIGCGEVGLPLTEQELCIGNIVEGRIGRPAETVRTGSGQCTAAPQHFLKLIRVQVDT